MPLDQLQALKQKSNPNSEPINSSNPDSQKPQKKSKLPNISKLPKFVIPIFAGSLILILIIIAGFFGYKSFFSTNIFSADKDAIRGKITKVDIDYDLIIKPEIKDGVDCSADPKIQEEKGLTICPDPIAFQYYTAGTYNKGRYKDYTRIIGIEKNSGLMAIFATKNYTKFIFNGDPLLKTKSPEDNNYIYKVIRQDKVSDIDFLPQEFNQFLELDDQFVLSSLVIDKGVFCKNISDDKQECAIMEDKTGLVELGKKSGYTIYSKPDQDNKPTDRYYVADQTGLIYTGFVNSKQLVQYSSLEDSEGKKIRSALELMDKKNEKDDSSVKKQFPSYDNRSKLCPYFLSFASQNVDTKSTISSGYNYGSDNCYLINESGNNYTSKLKVVDLKNEDTESIGTIKDTKIAIYAYKDKNHPNLKELFDQSTAMTQSDEPSDMSKWSAKNPLLLVKDPFGRYLQIEGGDTLVPSVQMLQEDTVSDPAVTPTDKKE